MIPTRFQHALQRLVSWGRNPANWPYLILAVLAMLSVLSRAWLLAG